jgi:uncharacterized sporulation protein YeaH/YhbH (DUF444 family)
MPRRIEEDHKDFRDVYSGRIRKALKKFIKNGSIFRTRGDGSKINITIPKIDIPHIVYGNNGEGIGRGEGGKGDVIGQDDDGQGQGAGQGHADGITIAVELDDVLKFLQDELQLPDLRPKPNQTYDEVKIKYNSIALQGPESLRHNRRTMQQALKRMAASGELNKTHFIPGYADPVKLITPINSDRRYRRYQEVKVPASNAVIFFARDGSASMDQYKCDIVSDMSWWIDVWIRKFYKRVERCYIWHDTEAFEVDENKFYRYRYGGGTTCSSALKLIDKQLENRFPPEKWNIYVIYFSDGENWGDDNRTFCKTIEEQFPNDIVNFIGITQILSWSYQGSLKEYVDKNLVGKLGHLRTTSIGPEESPDMTNNTSWGFYGTPQLSEDERNEQVQRAIIDLLGKDEPKITVPEQVGE